MATLILGQTHITQTMYNTTFSKSKMAIPDFKLQDTSGVFDEAWSTINQVLKRDIQNSGYFDVLPETRIKLIQSPFEGTINFEEWGSIEAEHLVVGRIMNEEGSMRVEVRLFEVPTRKTILAKAYKSKPNLSRKTAHIIADDIMKYLRNIGFATSKIIFSKDSFVTRRKEARTLKELYIMDYDGFNQFPITAGGIAISPSASMSGNDVLLAYCSYEKAFTIEASYGIFLKKGLRSQPVKLFGSKGNGASTPAISPDGKKVAFALSNKGNVDLWVMNLNGSDLLRLTRHPSVDTNPSWAPGGNAILYTSDRTGSPQIYRMDADGLNNQRITFENPYNDSAVWNPRYDYIAYVSRFDNDFDIFVLDLKTKLNYRLTVREGSNEDPCWSPDGERICFSSNRSGSWQLYVVNRTDKDSLIQVTRTGQNRTPIWIP
jgi:TolB protein